MSDLISRESLKQRINLNYNSHQYIDAQSIKDIIDTEPSVEDKTVEELEKIKYEMLLKRDSVELFQNVFNWNIELIDKRIAELKGD